MDYISMDVVGSVITDPKESKSGYSFKLENKRGKSVSTFNVFVRSNEPVDVNKGDRVFISKAGFYVRNGENCLAVVEGSDIEVIRVRCNEGVKEV